MSKPRRFRVYLGGPIAGCNDLQARRWRNEVRNSRYKAHFDFADPMDGLLDRDASSYEIVEADLRAIADADGVLVNMWRASIGSAMGVVHAHRAGRPVVVADPNHLGSRPLEFYADAVVDTPLKAANILLDLLRAEAGWTVIKSAERGDEPFDRRKLMAAVRGACRGAGRDDIVVPGIIFPAVIDRLKKSKGRIRKQLAAGQIHREALDALSALEGDPAHAQAVAGVAARWRSRFEGKRSSPPGAPRRRPRGAPGGGVEVSCGEKSHATIWGRTVRSLDDVPSVEARAALGAIREVPGVTRIVLGPFGRGRSRRPGAVEVSASATPHVIEGRLFDKGSKGDVQSFQVWVQFDADKDRIRAEIAARSPG